MNLEIKYSMHIDLLFHVLAYLKVRNASNCYSQLYIDEMSIEKNTFNYNILPAIEGLQKYYNENFERLMMINFLAFYSNSYDELKQIFIENNSFTEEDKWCFISPFIEVLDNESKFYFQYWQKKHESFLKIRSSLEQALVYEFNKYNCLFIHFNRQPQLYLSYSITQNGRGIYSKFCFSAMVPFPSVSKDFDNTFFTALHEYTHQFTEHLLNKDINMSDNTHNISEFLVILADYYIIKSIDRDAVRRYFDWLAEKTGNTSKEISDDEFINIFRIENDLEIVLKKTLNNIPNIIAL